MKALAFCAALLLALPAAAQTYSGGGGGGAAGGMATNASNASLPTARANLGFLPTINPVKDGYGAVCAGTSADDTTAINNAIAALMNASGGTLLLPGTCRMDGALVIPYTGTAPPMQKPLRITSLSPVWGGLLTGANPGGGGGLDLRFNGDAGAHVAKIDTRGQGYLEIDHITLSSGGTDNFLFIQTTNTTLNIHDNRIIGNTGNTGTTAVQDVIQLGGITDASSTLQGILSTNGFQGYGSKIENNLFSHIRHAINFGGSANGVYVANNTTDTTCGSGTANDAPYVFFGAGLGAQGNTIFGGIVELTNYPQGVAFIHTTAATGINKLNDIIGLGLYDQTLGVTTVGAYYFSTTDSTQNLIIDGFVDTALNNAPAMNGPGAGVNTRITSSGIPFFSNSITLGGVTSSSVLGTTAGGQIGATTTTGTGNAVLAAAPTVNGLTNGLGTGQALLNIDGGSSGSGNGPALYFKEGGNTKLAVGAYSAINGGAFDDTLTLQNLNGGGKVRVAGSTGGFQVDGGPIIAGTTTSTPVHQRTGQTTAPALTSCGGGSPAITGTDTAGIVTMGTTATGCVITFNVAYASAPYCVVTWIATPLASQSYATSNTAITLTQTSTSGNKVQYICMAQAGG